MFRYAGECFDKETGTIYLRARYYDPRIGRFISEDSYWGDDADPLSLNLYTYCGNDPVNFIDPSGNIFFMPRNIDIGKTFNGLVNGVKQWFADRYNDYVNYSIDIIVKDKLSRAGIKETDPNYFFYYNSVFLKEKIAFEKQNNNGNSSTEDALNALLSFDVKGFNEKISKMAPSDRVANVKQTAKDIADKAGLKKDSRVSKLNGRDVYVDPKTGNYYSVDTQHGTFEVTNSRGKHLGECDYNFNGTKPADTSGGHDLKVK